MGGMGGAGGNGRVKGNDMGVTSMRAVGVPDKGNGRIKYTGLLDADRGGVPNCTEAEAETHRIGVVGSAVVRVDACGSGGGSGGVGGMGMGMGMGTDDRLPKSMATSNSV